MGRVAAAAWGVAGVLATLGAALEAPSRAGDILTPYAVRDARTILLGCAVAATAGAVALYGSRREWQGRRSWWLAIPAMVLVSGAAYIATFSWDPRDFFFWIPMLASPYGIWFMALALRWGLAATLVVALVDAFVEHRRARPA